jgi:hypothetical protein
MTRRIKVLIIEDQPEWSKPLAKLYQQLIEQIPAIPLIQIVHTSAEADAALSIDRFDLLSLDINLSETHPAAHWDDLLKLAKQSCTAVIIVTGIAYEPEFADTNLTINEKAIDIFGSRNKIKIFQKPSGHLTPAVIATTIDTYKQQLPITEFTHFCDHADIDYWHIIAKSIAASTYILVPTPNAWAESDRFANLIRRMIMNIAKIYGQENEVEDWHDYLMSQNRIARLKWLASLCKVFGAFFLTIIGFTVIHPPAIGGIVGGFCGLLLGGFCGLTIYRHLILEISIRSIGHFSRNHVS